MVTDGSQQVNITRTLCSPPRGGRDPDDVRPSAPVVLLLRPRLVPDHDVRRGLGGLGGAERQVGRVDNLQQEKQV